MKTDAFKEYLLEQVRNHSIYVWGAQGQKKPTITEEWIRKREKTKRNADRAIRHWKKEVAAGYGDVLRASELADGPGHNSAFCFEGQWYVAYHRRTIGDLDPNHRKLCIDKLDIVDGKLSHVEMT